MHIAHICKVKGIAGAERHLLMLLPGLMARGIDITMLVLEDPEEPATSFVQALSERDIPYQIVPIHADVDPGLLLRLAEILEGLAPDIVHTHLVHADLYGLNAAQRAGIDRAVSSRHNDNPFRRNVLIKSANRLSLRQANRVIAISNALREFIIEVEGIDPDMIEMIHYGLEPLDYPTNAQETARQRMHQPPDVPVVGMFGRLIRQKGVDVLLKAFTLVHFHYPQARLVIAGDGELRETLEALAVELRIADVVSFLGWVSDAPQLMPGCDIVVMPSRWEGFGLVALEAMSAARPLIASTVSALPEIVVDQRTGLLIPEDEPGELAAAIERLIANPAEAAQFGQAGYDRLRASFSVEAMVEATADVYDRVLAPAQETA